ncbi:xanthine dehydrogenase family protein molybdopterin-binding subunit [Nonomuraea sp. MG754425]|uniref:xanthine dehydrogenase family protein molybdopterin-binding subunit n=1 Tax=Nonomuraea sp. MG754425 TaxID=2570319 RepID=UPI001F3E60DF|nr:xanthine dehydrogenase family protein molybdopterin-binding subunit [Nonomuraea sp. MG754425]MCF6468754.1 xanthine dehydrogenase family protein molybdopterin-binding subunit [Nonomuraea sp. MG754425]
MNRTEGRVKVTGLATYAAEYPVENVAYAYAVQAQIAKGRVKRVDGTAALEQPGVLAVLSCEAAPRLSGDADPELALFQSREVAYRGQIVAAVVADTYEIARAAAAAVRVDYDADDHDVRLSADHPGLYQPETVNPDLPSETQKGDVEEGLARAERSVDVTYRTPVLHNNPMEPHAALASWDTEGRLLVYDTSQGVTASRATIAQTLGLPPEQVRVVARHVGGGFGSKGTTRPQAILAALASRMVGRPVKIVLTRQQMFDVTGYRTPTIQRVRLGVDAEGRLTALEHMAYEQSSTLVEFAEQTSTPSRVMYAAPALRTGHRLVRLDVATPSWMRAPGECPGMYALESAMDELAYAAGLDPVELRVRNDPETEPDSGLPFSSRNLVGCLREGAHRFGWEHRDPTPGIRREGEWLIGTGVAASTYPTRRWPSQAVVTTRDGDFLVQLAAADIGTGARTVLARIAAGVLGVAPERVHVELGDSDLPQAPLAGGSMGTASWGTAVVRACEELMRDGKEGRADTTEEIKADAKLARHAFGAQFAQVRVSSVTGEIRVSRLLGVFAAGRIVDATLARSQFLGGMTMGLGMALMEETVTDEEFGGFLHRDLAQYHVPACADAQHVEAVWLDERDDRLNPMGSKGIGEIGIVGTAAAIGNAVHHATGHRIRELPITPAKILALRP